MKKKNGIIVIIFVVLVVVTYFVMNQPGNKTPQISQFDFAIEDTAKVDKIFIADRNNKTILLERIDGVWYVNNKDRAKPESVDLLLKTFKLIQLKNFVPESAMETIIRNMSGSNTKVEIYQGGDKPVKIYYVGHPTYDHQGTYMLLETPEHGKSDIPVVVDMKGFYGSLTRRFFTDELQWRYTGVFNYDIADIHTIEMDLFYEHHNSFKIELLQDGNVKLYDVTEEEWVTDFDSTAVKEYAIRFKKVHFEQHNRFLSETQIDSVKKELPAFEIRVTDRAGETNKITAWYKKAAPGDLDDEGYQLKYDRERMWAIVNDDEFVVIQLFVFNDLFLPLDHFLKSKTKEKAGV